MIRYAGVYTRIAFHCAANIPRYHSHLVPSAFVLTYQRTTGVTLRKYKGEHGSFNEDCLSGFVLFCFDVSSVYWEWNCSNYRLWFEFLVSWIPYAIVSFEILLDSYKASISASIQVASTQHVAGDVQMREYILTLVSGKQVYRGVMWSIGES